MEQNAMFRWQRILILALLALTVTSTIDSAFAANDQQRMMKIGGEVVSEEVGRAFVQAQELISKKNYALAEAALKSIVRKAPNAISIQYKYGFVLLQQNKFDAALEQAKKCTEIAPNFALGWALLGEAAMELHLDDQAKEAYKKSLALEPKGENADIIKEHLAELENPPQPQFTVEETAANEKINEENKRAMKINSALALCDSATKHFAQKQFEQGMQECRDAVKLAPDSDRIKENFVVYLNNYAADCVQNQKLKQAESLMQEAITFQKQGGITTRSQLTTLKNYLALLNFQGRSEEAKQIELQMKSVSLK